LVNIPPPQCAIEHALELLNSITSNTSNGGATCIDVDRPNDNDEPTMTMGGLGTFIQGISFCFSNNVQSIIRCYQS